MVCGSRVHRGPACLKNMSITTKAQIIRAVQTSSTSADSCQEFKFKHFTFHLPRQMTRTGRTRRRCCASRCWASIASRDAHAEGWRPRAGVGCEVAFCNLERHRIDRVFVVFGWCTERRITNCSLLFTRAREGFYLLGADRECDGRSRGHRN